MKNLYVLLVFIVMTQVESFSFGQNEYINSKASNSIKAFCASLENISDKGVIFGHQDDLAYGIGWKAGKGCLDIREVYGVYIGKKIPMIFRSFYKCTGDLFWWEKGNYTKEEYIALWQYTVNYLIDVKKVHHDLFAYSTDQFNSWEQYLEFYLHNEYVDIIAIDDYHSTQNVERFTQLVFRLIHLNSVAYIAAFFKTGIKTFLYLNWFTEVLLDGVNSDTTKKRIAYVMIWSTAWPHHNHFAPYSGLSRTPEFKIIKEDLFTLFEVDLPNMYKIL